MPIERFPKYRQAEETLRNSRCAKCGRPCVTGDLTLRQIKGLVSIFLVFGEPLCPRHAESKGRSSGYTTNEIGDLALEKIKKHC